MDMLPDRDNPVQDDEIQLSQSLLKSEFSLDFEMQNDLSLLSGFPTVKCESSMTH